MLYIDGNKTICRTEIVANITKIKYSHIKCKHDKGRSLFSFWLIVYCCVHSH